MFNFDNTKSVKDFAATPAALHILNHIQIGNQKQLYTIGQKVNANGIQNATITDCYFQNGYCYYVIKHKFKRKTYTSNQRQQDLQII